jgi:hypothetical protein
LCLAQSPSPRQHQTLINLPLPHAL